MPTSSSLPASGLDIVAYRGDTFERWVRIRRNGIEENLQSSIFVMQIRRNSQLIHEISSTSTLVGRIEIASPDNGVLLLRIPATEMAKLEAGTYSYDVEQRFPAPSDRIQTRFRGAFQITDDITRPS